MIDDDSGQLLAAARRDLAGFIGRNGRVRFDSPAWGGDPDEGLTWGGHSAQSPSHHRRTRSDRIVFHLLGARPDSMRNQTGPE